MSRFGKWIGAGLGWTIGGPIGALLGFAFGSLVDAAMLEKYEKSDKITTTGDFIVSLLVLIAASMKADNRVVQSELDLVKRYLIKTFGEDETAEMLLLLRDLLKKDIPLEDVGNQIKRKMNYASRLELLHLIYGIISADGSVDISEMNVFESIASSIGVTASDARSMKSMYTKSTDWAYEVLEIKKDASPEQIKRAYRQLALKNHPDRVSYLGEEIRKKANEKFSSINEAYEVIKKEKNIN
jgi:DnaJ like chaperone protein